MSYAIHHDPQSGIAELTFTGPISAETLRKATAEGIALQKRAGVFCFLIDAKRWDLEASVVDIYELPAKTYRQEDLDARTRMAIMLPGAVTAQRGVLFFQDACLNRGWNARVFDDRAAALEWLSKE